eukprot:54622-Eustigmatos_ZCMA.PRE.1
MQDKSRNCWRAKPTGTVHWCPLHQTMSTCPFAATSSPSALPTRPCHHRPATRRGISAVLLVSVGTLAVDG